MLGQELPGLVAERLLIGREVEVHEHLRRRGPARPMPADLADNRARMIRHSGAGRQAASRDRDRRHPPDRGAAAALSHGMSTMTAETRQRRMKEARAGS